MKNPDSLPSRESMKAHLKVRKFRASTRRTATTWRQVQLQTARKAA